MLSHRAETCRRKGTDRTGVEGEKNKNKEERKKKESEKPGQCNWAPF